MTDRDQETLRKCQLQIDKVGKRIESVVGTDRTKMTVNAREALRLLNCAHMQLSNEICEMPQHKEQS